MSVKSKALHTMLLASGAIAATIQRSPKLLSILEDKVKSWSGDAHNVPDGKMLMLCKDLSDKSADFIINTTPNNLFRVLVALLMKLARPTTTLKWNTNTTAMPIFCLLTPLM